MQASVLKRIKFHFINIKRQYDILFNNTHIQAFRAHMYHASTAGESKRMDPPTYHSMLEGIFISGHPVHCRTSQII